MEYASNMCCHVENEFTMILIISIIPPNPCVEEKRCNGKAEANIILCIIAPMVPSPRIGEYDQPIHIMIGNLKPMGHTCRPSRSFTGILLRSEEQILEI